MRPSWHCCRARSGAGFRIGQFRRVDVDRTAQFVSTHLDGLVTTATIRPDVEVGRIISHLERVLFDYLGGGEAAAAVGAASNGARLAVRPS